MKTRPTTAIVLILLIALLFGALWPAFQSPGPPEDEGIALVYPEMFMKGRLPYRDFETIYGPGNLLVLSTAYSLLGNNIFVERTVGLTYRLLVLVAIVAVAQYFGTIAAVGCGLLVSILFAGLDLFANTWVAAIAFELIGMFLASKRESLWACAAAGLLFALGLLCRCDIAPAALIAYLPLVWAMQRNARLGFFAGTAVGLLPLLWFAIVMGPAQLFHSLFIFPVFELSGSAYLPISTAPSDLRSFFFLSIGAGVVNLIAAVVAVRQMEGARLFLAVAIFGAACLYYALSR